MLFIHCREAEAVVKIQFVARCFAKTLRLPLPLIANWQLVYLPGVFIFPPFFFCENKNKKCTISMSLTPHLYFILFCVSFMRADDIIDTHMGSVCSLQLNWNCAVCTRPKSLRKALWNWVNARNVCRSDLVAWKFRKVIRRLTRLPFLNYFVMKLSVACLVSLFGLTWH